MAKGKKIAMNIQKNIYIFLFVICAKEINNLFEIAT
jgi:hypothetical protein